MGVTAGPLRPWVRHEGSAAVGDKSGTGNSMAGATSAVPRTQPRCGGPPGRVPVRTRESSGKWPLKGTILLQFTAAWQSVVALDPPEGAYTPDWILGLVFLGDGKRS